MCKVEVVSLILTCFLWLTLTIFSTTCAAATNTTTTATPIAKPGCPTRCGNLVVPYPFGIGLDGACSMGYWYNIRCDTSFNPAKPFISQEGILEILEISESQIRSKNLVFSNCYDKGSMTTKQSIIRSLLLGSSPLVFSGTTNKLTVIGCDDTATMIGISGQEQSISGCIASCFTQEDAIKHNGSCLGLGCCQTSIPKGLKSFGIIFNSSTSHQSVSSFNPCGYAFLADKEKYTFNAADLSDPTFATRINENIPIVYEWVVGANETCRQAQMNLSSYACQQNTICTDFNIGPGGYRCTCLPGYHGNPYLPPGCTDINECAGGGNPCSNKCINTPGNYTCSCPNGHEGDGHKNGTSCTINSQFVTGFSVGLPRSNAYAGMSFGFLFLLMLLSWIYFTIRRKTLKEKRELFFGQNGGNLLKQLLPDAVNGASTDSSKIFSAQELKATTKNYSEDRVLGKGGFGTVYKGILKNGREVAIKRSKLSDQNETQIKEFINEVVILTEIKHVNVVKLIGCCLETEVPLLVLTGSL